MENSGWLLLNSRTRRAYTVFESTNATIIRSFDLDTLKPRGYAKVMGVPIPGGNGFEVGGSTVTSAELVHAVDPISGRVYIPMAGVQVNASVNQPDAQRSFVGGWVLVIDEKAFDEGRPGFGAMTLPPEHAYLHSYFLMGLTVSRHHVRSDQPGKLIAAFAAPHRVTAVPVAGGPPLPGPYDHTLVQWDVSAVRTNQAATTVGLANGTLAGGNWSHVLGVCASAPMTSLTAGAANGYQLGILATEDAVYIGCQAAPQVAAVAAVDIDRDTGMAAPHLAGEQVFRLTKPIADTVVDPSGERLFVRTFPDGATWWVFEAATRRYSGSVAASTEGGTAMAVGIDPGSGRFWTLTPDSCVTRADGGLLPVRGGLKFVEAGLDPVPASEIVDADLAYPASWAIRVDSVTRRVFVRRGRGPGLLRHVYPSCDPSKRVPAPAEPFYRVLEDRTPLAERPDGLDDSNFTTNVAEAEGVTQASYLGSGTGYGSRLMLTGGLSAITNGNSDMGDPTRSPCSRDDREILGGSVGKVEVSDQSTAADAAGLDADGRTQDALGNPVGRCKPQAPQPTTGQPGEEWNKCSPNDGVPAPPDDELAFDERKPNVNGKPVDDNKDRCPDRDGESRYAAHCLGDEGSREPKGFSSRKVAPRAGFVASVTCDAAHDRAVASSTGSLGAAELDHFQQQAHANGAPVPDSTEALRVARSSSTVKVTRAIGKGITVTVDSWARGIDIPGVGSIGAVRSEATSTATGRDGRAEGRYERTICDVHLADQHFTGCLGEGAQRTVVKALNDAFGGRGEVRLRSPDLALLEGTAHGYLAAVQRDRKELFADQVITRDRSLTIPGLEIILYQGDGGAWGAGRQVLQLAGVQASTSYGIACLYGTGANGKCARDGEAGGLSEDDFGLPPDAGETEIITVVEEVPYEVPAAADAGSSGGGMLQKIVRVVQSVPRAVEEAIRLAFNNPRELGLLGAVWALLFVPCWLGERRGSVASLRMNRRISKPVGDTKFPNRMAAAAASRSPR